MSLVPPRPSPLAPGFRLDRYELLCPIAEGGMASVWIARQTGKHGFQRMVAVKTILPKYAAEPRFQKMFLDEARIASRIEHPHVAQIVDVGEQHEVTYLVMEYVDGDSLSKVLRAATKAEATLPAGLPLGVVLRVMADICGGLHAAHELRDEIGEPLGVVHRDVSPQNILVTTQGISKLIDFGIAKARDRLAGETNTDQVKGKVQYMAPEHAIGRPVDRRADVWAVGAVLYHMLGGHPPFEADNDIQTLFLLASGKPPPPLPKSVHPAVQAVITKALAHAPERRYSTAAALQRGLEEAMQTAGAMADHAAVASCLASLVGDRADKRKQAIALGLRAADEREKVALLMDSNTERHQGSTSAPRSAGTLAGDRTAVPTAPDSTTSPSIGHTLGSAALSIGPRHRERNRGLRFALVGGCVGAGLAVLALVAAGRSGNATKATGGTVPPAATAALPASPPVAPSSAAVSGPSTSPSVDGTPSGSAAAAAPPASASPPPLVPPRPQWRPATPVRRAKPRVYDGF